MTLQDRIRLDGRVAIVTGASSGLGVAFACALGEAGADLVLGARRLELLEQTKELVEQSGSNVAILKMDVARPDDCARLVDLAMSTFGRVDILVNNAGVGTAYRAIVEPVEEFRRVIDVNLNGAFWMAQACGRVMKPGSSIVNIGSVVGLTTVRVPQAAYSASKAGIIGLTRDLAQQWTGRKHIRVNALAPGLFESEMSDQYRPETVAEIISRTPAGRLGELDELCDALIFLSSDASSYISGVTLPVDGGLLTG